MIIKFIILDDHETYPDDAHVCGHYPRPNNPATPYGAALAIAEQYHGDGGYERNDWPLRFEIYFDGKSRGVFESDVEAIPSFSVRKVEK